MTLELKDTKVLQFNPDALQDVRKEHGLDHQGMCQAIDILQEWILKQEHFVKKDFNRDYLERVIISTKGSIERAKTRLDKMCMLRTVLPEFYEKCHARNDFPTLGDKTISLFMPKQTEDNCRIFIMQPKTNITAVDLMDVYKYSVIMSEYIKLKDYSNSVYGILDNRNMNITDFVSNFNPIDSHKAMSLYMNGYGFRIKAMYILSTSRMVNAFVNILKPLFPAKVGQRIQVFRDVESLYKYLPKNLLPEDYGGEQKSLNTIFENWTEELSSEEHVNYMKEMRQYCTNESMRRSDKFNEEYLGMPGSFKLLNVD